MNNLGRGNINTNVDRHERKLLERAVTALEKLADDPVLEIESGPPLCPFCGNVADIKVQEDEGEGSLALYVIRPECLNCNNKFYAVPIEWAIFSTNEEAEEELNKRAEVFGTNVGNS
jgi:hypothetical protein